MIFVISAHIYFNVSDNDDDDDDDDDDDGDDVDVVDDDDGDVDNVVDDDYGDDVDVVDDDDGDDDDVVKVMGDKLQFSPVVVQGEDAIMVKAPLIAAEVFSPSPTLTHDEYEFIMSEEGTPVTTPL